MKHVSLDDYEKMGTFQNTQTSLLKLRKSNISKDDDEIQILFKQKNYVSFLRRAIQSKKNILISGATSTGKTTFLNACLQEIPLHEHIITLEDVPEVKPPHPLHTALFASKGLQGVAKVTMQDLVQASLRIRPDRIILGELRGSEAADFINATATGHDGSISSLHASSPLTAFMRLTHMVKLSGIQLSRKAILSDLYHLIDVVVQLKRRLVGDKYIREVSEIYYADADLK